MSRALVLSCLVTACAPDAELRVAALEAPKTAGAVRALQGEFVPIKEPDDLRDVSGLITTGGQYLDPGNGVPLDSWSLLVRWQGDDLVSAPVAYDLGVHTGFTTPSPSTQWQRGQQPEHPAGTPGVQLYGQRAGMLINTWTIPHRFIEGGGYNDMFGYAFSPARRPRAFVDGTGPTHLVLQAMMAVPWFGAWRLEAGAWTAAAYGDREPGDAQLGLFAYLEDETHPALPPIAVVVVAYGNRLGGCEADGAPGWVSYDYPRGV